jgi:hypothetical protein
MNGDEQVQMAQQRAVAEVARRRQGVARVKANEIRQPDTKFFLNSYEIVVILSGELSDG